MFAEMTFQLSPPKGGKCNPDRDTANSNLHPISIEPAQRREVQQVTSGYPCELPTISIEPAQRREVQRGSKESSIHRLMDFN